MFIGTLLSSFVFAMPAQAEDLQSALVSVYGSPSIKVAA